MDAVHKRSILGSTNASGSPQIKDSSTGNMKSYYGTRAGGFARRGVRGNFIPPIRSHGNNTNGSQISTRREDTVEESTRKW